MTAFPDSRPLGELLASTELTWPALPDGVTFTPAGESVCYVMMLMPDGIQADGCGNSMEAAEADARHRWRQWKRGHPRKLAVNGHEYRKRCTARARRRRA